MLKKIVIVVIVVLLGLVGFGAIKSFQSWQKTSHAKKISDTFVADVLAGNYNESYAMFSTTARKNTTATNWRGTVKTLSSFFASKQATYKSLDASLTYRVYSYTVPGYDGTYTFRVVEGLQNDDWTIQSFNSSRN